MKPYLNSDIDKKEAIELLKSFHTSFSSEAIEKGLFLNGANHVRFLSTDERSANPFDMTLVSMEVYDGDKLLHSRRLDSVT